MARIVHPRVVALLGAFFPKDLKKGQLKIVMELFGDDIEKMLLDPKQKESSSLFERVKWLKQVILWFVIVLLLYCYFRLNLFPLLFVIFHLSFVIALLLHCYCIVVFTSNRFLSLSLSLRLLRVWHGSTGRAPYIAI
jgi:hypothetical protein